MTAIDTVELRSDVLCVVVGHDGGMPELLSIGPPIDGFAPSLVSRPGAHAAIDTPIPIGIVADTSTGHTGRPGLRGARPDGLCCGEIGERMVQRVPDVTRLVDRLEKQGLVERTRDAVDRRMVIVKIGAAGLDLLASLDGPVEALHRRQLGHLKKSELDQLRRLLKKAGAGA